ncbi:MAG: arsenite methyltransferase [Gemmatimonadota bacterium]|nr:arsenite methyltransferase [Gemmatimonadota bacterium]
MTRSGQELKTTVRQRYGEAARQAAGGERAVCGPVTEGDGASTGAQGCGCGQTAAPDPVTRDLYSALETEALPEAAVLASLGCGNPTALAALSEGEIVLDLGSGGGIDVLLSARRVGPTGRAYGLDMTDEMLELARKNQAEAGVENAEFLRGEIENVPLPDESVDVVISNCVINLSTDKPRVLAEAFRVLRPGGRFAVSDIVVRGPVDERIRRSAELWIGCVAGALDEEDYRRYLRETGFEAIEIEPTRVYGLEDARALVASLGEDAQALASEAADRFMSAFVRARKPA